MGPLIIAGMLVGGIAGIASNQQRIKDQAKEKRLLELQQQGLRKKKYATAAILHDEMTIGALQATSASKKSAIEAYQAESMASANLGKSGIRGGTPYYMLDKALAEDKAALLEQADIVNKKLGIETQQGAMSINDIRNSLTISDEQMAQINDRLGYLSSPFSFMLSAATGALSGASMAMNIQKLGVAATGNANWGELPQKIEGPPAYPVTSFSTIPQVAPAFEPSAPLQFGGQNISNTAKIGSPIAPSVMGGLPFNLDLGNFDSPFKTPGSKSGLRFNF